MTSCSNTNPVRLGNICNAILGIKSIQIRCQYNNNVLHTYQYTSNTFFGCKYVCSTIFLFSRRGPFTKDVPHVGGRGVRKRRTWGDVEGGRGSWKRDVPSVCGKIHDFFSKKRNLTPLFLCLKCRVFQNPILLGILFEKSTILPMLRRKNTLNEGEGSAKSDILFMGGSAKSDLGWHGGRGVKNLKKRGDVLCERPLIEWAFFCYQQSIGA